MLLPLVCPIVQHQQSRISQNLLHGLAILPNNTFKYKAICGMDKKIEILYTKEEKIYFVLTLYSANFGVHFRPVSSCILFKLVGHRYPHVPGVKVIFSIKSVAAFVKGSPLGPNPLGRIQLFRLHSSLRKPCNIS